MVDAFVFVYVQSVSSVVVVVVAMVKADASAFAEAVAVVVVVVVVRNWALRPVLWVPKEVPTEPDVKPTFRYLCKAATYSLTF